MKQNKFILSLGSNICSKSNISLAVEYLSAVLPDILFSIPVYTSPVELPGSENFLNQVAVGHTHCSMEKVTEYLKEIEQKIGRREADKQKGIIVIDIDLLQWNDKIIKEKDRRCDYVCALLDTLPEEDDIQWLKSSALL